VLLQFFEPVQSHIDVLGRGLVCGAKSTALNCNYAELASFGSPE